MVFYSCDPTDCSLPGPSVHGISYRKNVSELIRSEYKGLGYYTRDKMFPNNSLGSRMDPRG